MKMMSRPSPRNSAAHVGPEITRQFVEWNSRPVNVRARRPGHGQDDTYFFYLEYAPDVGVGVGGCG